MKLTKINVYPVNKNNLLAFAQVVFDDLLVVNGFKLVHSTKKNIDFLAMPSNIDANGDYRDICYFFKKSATEELEKKIKEEYYKKIKKLSKDGENAFE